MALLNFVVYGEDEGLGTTCIQERYFVTYLALKFYLHGTKL